MAAAISRTGIVYKVGRASKRSPDHPNEDRAACLADLDLTLKTGLPCAPNALVAVADGHGGPECAAWIASNLSKVLATEIGMCACARLKQGVRVAHATVAPCTSVGRMVYRRCLCG